MSRSTRILRMARIAWASVLFFSLFILSACGGGTSTGPKGPPNNGGKKLYSVTGGGVKGPLAKAPFEFYEFDAGAPNYQSVIAAASGVTNEQAAFDGVLIPAANPPYFLVFSANQSTKDLTTGTTPVIKNMKTAVTSEMLSRGYPIYATPLTTIAVELAVANAESTVAPYDFPKSAQAYENFLKALPIAARQVVSTLGFGMSTDVDIFNTWPVVGTDSSSTALQTVAEYRAAVEALSTLAHLMGQSAGVSGDQILLDIAADLGDGVIDGMDKQGQLISNLGANELAILQTADPASLVIPNSTNNVLVGDVSTLLATEAPSIGATADTTALTNGTVSVTLTAAQVNTDRDGDGVLNIADAFPDDAARDRDTDGDGLADDIYVLDIFGVRTGAIVPNAGDPDDDNDGLEDIREVPGDLGTDPLLADTDGDGILDSVEIVAVGGTATISYGIFAGSYPGTGTDPLNSDTDGDGILDGVEFAPVGSVFVIASGPNAGRYTGTGTDPNLSDTDGDGLSDGAEVTAQSNPLVTDTDGDGKLDSVDNCPAVANPDQADGNLDGIGDACSVDLTGIWKLTYAVKTMTWNACDRSRLGTSYHLYQSIEQDGLGNLTAIDHRGVASSGSMNVGVNIFNLQGSVTEIDPQYGNTITRQVTVDGRINLDGTMSGSYIILEEVDGVAICQENGDMSGAKVYVHDQGNGSKFNGLYALEYDDVAYYKFDPVKNNKRNSAYAEFDINGANYRMFENHAGESVISRQFIPSNGSFSRVSQYDELKDTNNDGVDDQLVHNDETITGLMVRDPADASGATLVFYRIIKSSVYPNTTVFDPNAVPQYVIEQRLDGYGRPVSAQAYNETLAEADATGAVTALDRIGLKHPPLRNNSSASQLRFDVFAGTDTSVPPLCSQDLSQGLVFVTHYPQPDMVTEAISNGEYAYVECDMGVAGSVAAGAQYTLAMVDDMGTAADTSDDQITYSTLYTAVATETAPAQLPDRRSIVVDGASSSQTQANALIPIDGFYNQYADHAMSWADQGASGYRVSLRELNPISGVMGMREKRIDSTATAVAVPDGMLNRNGTTAIHLASRFDGANGSAWSRSRGLYITSAINGLYNVEMVDGITGEELHFQIALQRTDQNAFECTITYSNKDLSCISYYMLGNWSNNTITLNMNNPSLQITGTQYLYMNFQFSDAATATVSVGDYSGTAKLVTTELRTKTQVLADGSESTVLELENPLPLFASGQLSSVSGLADLDGLGSATLTLWDEMDVDPANHFTAKRRGGWEHPASDLVTPETVTRTGYDTASLGLGSYVLGDDDYRVSLLTQLRGGSQDLIFETGYASASTAEVRGPVMADIQVNAVNATAGLGDSYLTPMDISAQTAMDMGWLSFASSTTQWALVIRQVDVDGSVTGTAGQLIPNKTWRTPYMDPVTDTSLVVTPGPTMMDPDAWAWSNGGFMDLAAYLAPGDVVQVQVVSRNALGNLQGLSDPVYVKMGP